MVSAEARLTQTPSERAVDTAGQMLAGGLAALYGRADSSSRVRLRSKGPMGYGWFRSELAGHTVARVETGANVM
jgi:hypothetical protein